MTNRLDKLEAAGFIAREPDPDDRRALIVRLTPAGIGKIDEAVNAAPTTSSPWCRCSLRPSSGA